MGQATKKPTLPSLAAKQAVDTRQAISAWALMVWAYRREQVRVAGRIGDDRRRLGYAATCWSERIGGGGGGIASAHPDADVVADHVKALPRDHYWLVVRAAEAGEPPAWVCDLPPGRFEPVLRANGRPRMYVCPISHRPTGCLVRFEGVPEAERRARHREMRANYAAFWAVCWHLMMDRDIDARLTRWRIRDVGLPRAPWLEGVEIGSRD